MKNYKEIKSCRISKSKDLKTILDLGAHYLTGVFPKNRNTHITKGPLELVWSKRSGLVQLKHSFNPSEMYGSNYGYRSGLNNSMVQHLKFKVERLLSLINLRNDDIVLDIGSNDGTLLKCYEKLNIKKIGIDPTAGKFKKFYSKDVEVVEDFFSKDSFFFISKNKKAKIITSIAMFYDLEDPSKFVADINETLSKNGIWHFEQSYLPTMLRMNSYDTICHEHIEYYTLNVIKDLLEKNDMKILDVELNSINGGSFAVTAAKKQTSLKSNDELIDWLLEQENRMGLNTLKPYELFARRVFKHKKDLKDLISNILKSGKTIAGYGASTKGNVLLQFCNLTHNQISFIAEINKEKFGSFTPGTKIPIISETEARKKKPDYMLVLPWHFRDGIINREQEYLKSGGRLIFPLPEIEVI